MSVPGSSRAGGRVVHRPPSGGSPAADRRRALTSAVLVTLVVVGAGLGVVWFSMGRAGGPASPLPPADLGCVAEPGAVQRDVDPDDSPESPWRHAPGSEITVYFATADLPRRYADMVATGAQVWSKSPCIEALAVEACPAGANCTTVEAEERSRDRGTDGETSSVDRDGVRLSSRITLYTALLDKSSDNGALATVVHEMGHALGLVHRKQGGTVMNENTDDHTDPVPDETDFANLRVIYG